jgi:hypothetical protein
MEFVFQILAELFSPVDEEKVKAENIKVTEEVGKAKVTEETVDSEEPNLFGIMDFH